MLIEFLFSAFPEAEALGNAMRFKAKAIGPVMACGCSLPQCGENTDFFPGFPLGGIHN